MALTAAQQAEFLKAYGAINSSGKVDYDMLDKLNGVSKPSANYVTNKNGITTSQFIDNNTKYNVAKDSIFDPLSSNYNAIVANSGGKIALSDLDGDSSNGLSTAYNSGQGANSAYGIAQREKDEKASIANANSSSNNTSVGTTQEGYINQLKEAQKQAQLASLGKARDSSLSNLNAEKAQIQPLYYGMRGKESTNSQLQAKNFAEFMAQRGQSNAGVSGQAELSRNVALQGNIGQLNSAEANALTENSRRVTDTNNAYKSDVASANAGIEAQALQNQLSAYQQEQAYAREQANLDRSYNYQVGRDAISDNKSNDLLDYQKDRDTVEDTRYDQNYQQQLEQQKIDNNYRQMQSIIENEYRQGQMTLQERSQALNEAQLKFQQEQQKLDNTFRQQQATSDNTFRQQQLNADTAYKYASLNKSSSSSSGYTKTEIKDATTQQFDQLLNTDHAMTYEWLNVNEDELIDSLGYSGYKSLVDKYQKAVEEQAEKGYPKRLINSGGR